MKREKLLFFVILLSIPLSYFFTKPFANDFKTAKTTDIEAIVFSKNAFTTKSNNIIYKNGVLRLTFESKVKDPSKVAFVHISINEKPYETFALHKDEVQTRMLHLFKNNLLNIKIDKKGFNKDDSISVNFQFRDDLILTQDIFIVLILIIFFIYAHKHGLVGNFLLLYTNYLLILYAQQIGFGGVGFRSDIAYLSLCLLFFFVFVFINRYLKNIYFNVIVRYILLLLLVLPPLLTIVYGVSTHNQVSNDALNALFQSNVDEAYAYALDMLQSDILFSSFIYLIFLFYFTVKTKEEHLKINYDNFLMVSILTLSMFSLFVNMSIYFTLYAKYITYMDEISKFKKVAELRVQNLSDINASKAQKGETYVVVIGESQNRDHMGSYGYFRDTTPKLEKENLLQLEYPYSNQVYTTAVLSYALTEANSLNKIDYFKAYSIVDIVQRAGFKTYWITNQVLKGGWDNVISVIANRCDKLIGLNKGFGKTVSTSEYDMALLPYLQTILHKKTNENKIIFVHLMGNHNRYSDRYPKEFNKYNDYLQYDEMGNIVDVGGMTDFINSYDNSILYNDAVLSKIIDVFKKEKGALLYFADHSEGVDYRLAHTPDDFHYEMCDIPVYIYASSAYKKEYAQKVKNLKNNKDKLFNNAFVYDTLIGLMDIKTDRFEKEHDLSNVKYKLDADKAFTLHGEKLYTARDNYEYHKKKNAQYLKQKGIKFGVKNYESIAQIFQAYKGGSSSVTLSLYEKDGVFYIKNSAPHRLSFDRLVTFLKERNINLKVYVKLDVRIENSLVELEKKYNNLSFIVSKDILKKIPVNSNFVLAIDDEEIQKRIFALDKKALELMAQEYNKLIKKYHVKELYFNDKNINFVKKYLNVNDLKSYLVNTSKNICDKMVNFETKSMTNINKNMIFDLNYCTIFAQEKKYKSMGI